MPSFDAAKRISDQDVGETLQNSLSSSSTAALSFLPTRHSQPYRRLFYPLIGVILGLGAPSGALLLSYILHGGHPMDFFKTQLTTYPFFYIYMTIGSVVALALYAHLVGRRDDRLVSNLQQRTLELQYNLETLRQTQKDLMEKERFAALGLFSASVVHELANPLDSALDLTNLIEQTAEINTIKTEYAPLLRESLLKIEHLITKLRLLSRTSTSEPKEEINLGLLLSEVVDEITPRCHKKNIRVEIDSGTAPIMFNGFHEKLRHVFLNLALNAIEAMPTGGRLRFEVERDNGFIVTRVSDTGIGIPTEQLEKLFTPFASTKPQGMGLGLTIVASIVREHNGRIHVDSKKGDGTTVTVWLPQTRMTSGKE